MLLDINHNMFKSKRPIRSGDHAHARATADLLRIAAEGRLLDSCLRESRCEEKSGTCGALVAGTPGGMPAFPL
jgi:hypothetical protein